MARREQIPNDFPEDKNLRALATKTMTVRGFTTDARSPFLDFLTDVYGRSRFSALAIGKKEGEGTLGHPYLDYYLLLSEASDKSLFSEDCEQEIEAVAEKHGEIPNSPVLAHNIHVIYPQRYPTPQSFIDDQSKRFRQEPGVRIVGSIVFSR